MKSKSVFLATAIFSTFLMFSCKKELHINEPGNLVPKTVDQDASIPSISVNGTMLHSEAFGDPQSPMVIVLHGGPGGDYRSNIKGSRLANDGYYVVLYDQRGCGLSKRHPEEIYDLQLILDDLSAVIAHYRTSPEQKVFLLGHSWGAMLATSYINTYPDAIEGAIIAEPGGLTDEQTFGYMSRLRSTDIFGEITSDVMFPDQFVTGREDEYAILDYNMALKAAADGSAGNILGHDGPIPFWRYGATFNNALVKIAQEDGFDFTQNLDQFQTEILFVYSELNQAYGYNHAVEVSSAYPNVRLEMIGGTGHELMHFEQGWQNFHPLALEYLNSFK